MVAANMWSGAHSVPRSTQIPICPKNLFVRKTSPSKSENVLESSVVIMCLPETSVPEAETVTRGFMCFDFESRALENLTGWFKFPAHSKKLKMSDACVKAVQRTPRTPDAMSVTPECLLVLMACAWNTPSTCGVVLAVQQRRRPFAMASTRLGLCLCFAFNTG